MFGYVKNAVFVAILTGISILALYPFIWLISASLKPQGDVFDNKLIPREWQWNYTGDPSSARRREALRPPGHAGAHVGLEQRLDRAGSPRSSVAFSSAIVAFAFAYFRFPGRNVLFALILATMMLPGRGDDDPRLPDLERARRSSPARRALAFLPDIGVNTQYPLWVPNLFGSAFYIFLLRQFFLGIPRELFEAARIDGDSYFSMFRRIALPLAEAGADRRLHLRAAGEVVRPDDAAHLPARPRRSSRCRSG